MFVFVFNGFVFNKRILLKMFHMVRFHALVPIEKSSRTTITIVSKSRVFTITSLVFVVADVSHQEILLFM